MPYRTIQIPIATNGLNKDLQPTQIPASSPNMINMIVEPWGVRKRLGYSSIGINLPLPGIGMELIQYTDARGIVHQLALTDTGVFLYDSSVDQWLNIGAATIVEDCEDDWVADNANTCAAQATVNKVGTNAILVNIDADIAKGDLLCYEGIVEDDLTTSGIFTVWLRCDKALSANTLEIVLSNTAAASDPKTGTDGTDYITLTNPLAMAADIWYNFNIPLTGDDIMTNMDAVIQVALYCNHATELDGATTETNIYIDDLKTTVAFTGGNTGRWTHTTAVDATTFSNNGGTALVLHNNTDSIRYFEGHSGDTLAVLDVSDFASFSNAREIIEFWNHFFVLNYNNGNNNIRSLAYADLADIVDWTGGTSGANTLTDTIGNLRRAKKLAADLIIYSDSTITTTHYYGGNVLFSFPTLVYETGLFADKALWDFVDIHYFLGTDQKIYGYAGGRQLLPIGEAIEDSLFSDINISNKEQISFGIDPPRHKLYINYPGSGDTYATRSYVFNYKRMAKSWEYYEFADTIRDMSLFNNKVGWYADGPELAGTYANEVAFYADSSFTQSGHPTATFISYDGYIFKINEKNGTDNGTDIRAVYETMDITLDGEEHRGRIAFFSFNAMSSIASATVDMYYSIDGGNDWVQIELAHSISSTLANRWTQHRIPIDIDERKFRFKLEQNSAKDLQLRSMHIVIDETSDR